MVSLPDASAEILTRGTLRLLITIGTQFKELAYFFFTLMVMAPTELYVACQHHQTLMD